MRRHESVVRLAIRLYNKILITDPRKHTHPNGIQNYRTATHGGA